MSLRFSIGSDSEIHKENTEIKESKSETKFNKRKLCKLQSAISAASVNDNTDKEGLIGKVKPKRKKKRFNVMFSLAHF